ncbi:DNA-binding transcriptional regulator, LysR family [Pseudonocardia ammonioxydans]|uniref:DNA-binding transcriptional regulator, LysR family n=1 Tax=Pseudonocardia ammonioxydans TaxID=260086 RepID=A0A1I5FZE5_PSUAM|nr:LysR family transcriptional regulator [Pseudonocardia ammonioxydans]SFO28621.1 DNA-binding transcriptional regulator, LysR family [Pseudonocardia ammonioxydans]
MDVRQLRYLVEVIDAGSFLGASARLDTAQPSVWRQVKALEKELGVPLFERSGRSVQPTSAGLLLRPLAEQVLASADKLVDLAVEVRHGRAGIVTVECAYPHLHRFLAPLIGGFHSLQPDVKVAIHGLPGLPEVERVVDGDADVVTCLPRVDPRIAGIELGQARIVVVVPEEHPWRRRPTVDVTELAGVPVLVGPSFSLSRNLLEPPLRARGLALDIVYESHDFASLAALARAGLGVAVVADDHLPGEPIDHDWPRLHDGETSMATPVWLYWSTQRPLSPAVNGFVRHVQKTVPG